MGYETRPGSGLNVKGVNHVEPVGLDGSATSQHVYLSFVER